MAAWLWILGLEALRSPWHWVLLSFYPPLVISRVTKRPDVVKPQRPSPPTALEAEPEIKVSARPGSLGRVLPRLLLASSGCHQSLVLLSL